MSYSGKHAGLDVHVVWNGRDAEHGVDLVGTVPASLSTYLACQAFNPDLIISAGTAGGFKAKVRPATQRT
jgi:5'-methylthioadenosine nucleosidase